MAKSNINNPAFAISVSYFALSCAASRAHSEAAQKALKLYGDHGAQVSGCVRDHFPNDVKDHLRDMAWLVSIYSDMARDLKPYRSRAHTLNELARDVATRDGSGFYGPQPRR